MTADELRRIMPLSGERATKYADPLTQAMNEFDINTPERQAAFLAQIAHESGQLRYVEELASGNAYEGRENLGNVHEGDGRRFKGRGLIQITGRDNYAAVSEALDYDFLNDPEELEEADFACRSAAWYWKSRGLNELADRGNFRLITLKINGGYNGYQERLAYWARAKTVLT